MKIAQIAPPWIPVPPPGYGGVEWVVAFVADGLVERGHEVTLFAPPGSRTSAKLVSPMEGAPGTASMGDAHYELGHVVAAYLQKDSFDVIHDHSGFIGPSIGAFAGSPPVVHTLHGPFTDRSKALYSMLSGRINFVAISNYQRDRCPDLSYAATIYNGIDLSMFPFRQDKEEFFLFLGRMSPEKGAHLAIELARKAGARLVMATKIAEDSEKRYFAERVEPMLGNDTTLLGEVTHEVKVDLLSRARATLMTIQWPEPFGLVMAESMACGTPVIAWDQGSAPEIIADGKTGFLVDSQEQALKAIAQLPELSARACRAHVEKHFSKETMVRAYEEVFYRVAGETSSNIEASGGHRNRKGA